MTVALFCLVDNFEILDHKQVSGVLSKRTQFLTGLFRTIHWILFGLFITFWGLMVTILFFNLVLPEEFESVELFEVIVEMLFFQRGLLDFVFSAAGTWVPVVFYIVRLLVKGEKTFFPWPETSIK